MQEPDLAKTDPTKLEIWRESLAHLRHLSDEVAKRFQFYLWLNLVLFLSAIGSSRYTKVFSLIFLLAALSVAVVARHILKRNRIYYLQMLAKKSLIEDELGFYATKFSGTEIDFAFPWRLAPEVVAEIKKDLEAWVQKSVRADGTIALWQFVIYEMFIGLDIVALTLLLYPVFKSL